MSERGEKPEVLPGDLITRPGLYESRSQGVVEVRDCGNGYWEAAWEHEDLRYHSSGERVGVYALDDPYQLLHWVGPLPASEPEPETMTEQLVEIEGQGDTVQVREGRWRTRGGDIRNVTATPEGDGRKYTFPWWDAQYRQTWTSDGRYYLNTADQRDLIEYLGPIEQPQPVPQPQPQPHTAAIEELRSEVSYVQRLLGESRQRVTHLEELVTSLRTINEAQEKAFEAAGKENDALRVQVRTLQREADKKNSRIKFLETLDAGNGAAISDCIAKVAKLQSLVDTARGQLEAAATERDELRAAIDAADKQLDQKDAQIRDLRIELDAAQQVPQPVGDEEREQIWDEATEAAGRQVVRWLRPLTLALHRQPDERFRSFMTLTLSVLPSLLPELLGYAVEDETEGDDCEE